VCEYTGLGSRSVQPSGFKRLLLRSVLCTFLFIRYFNRFVYDVDISTFIECINEVNTQHLMNSAQTLDIKRFFFVLVYIMYVLGTNL